MVKDYRICCVIEQTQGIFAGLNTEHDLGFFKANSAEEAVSKAQEELSKRSVTKILEISVCETK